VRGQHHTPAALYPRENPVPIVQEAGWAPGPVWTGAENLAPPEFDPRTIQTVAIRYTDYATRPTVDTFTNTSFLHSVISFFLARLWLLLSISFRKTEHTLFNEVLQKTQQTIGCMITSLSKTFIYSHYTASVSV
jgi:hypothetical protein